MGGRGRGRGASSKGRGRGREDAVKNYLLKILVMEDEMEVEKLENKMIPVDIGLQWSQWQPLDSILPTGGFAHSFGLDAATQA
ncbi:hypothetical protein QQ045_024595 [Rhodiola kirilowii]